MADVLVGRRQGRPVGIDADVVVLEVGTGLGTGTAVHVLGAAVVVGALDEAVVGEAPLQREAQAVLEALVGVLQVDDVAERAGPAAAVVGPAVPGVVGGLDQVDVLDQDVGDVLGEDPFHRPLQAPREFPVVGQVDAGHLREEEVLVHDVDFARLHGETLGLVVGVGHEGGHAAAGHVVAGELDAGIAELVRDPHVRGPAGEHAHTAAEQGLAVAGHIPVEAQAGRPQDVAGGHLAGVDAEHVFHQFVIAGLVADDGDVHAQSEGEV